jgi:hypothetical protein
MTIMLKIRLQGFELDLVQESIISSSIHEVSEISITAFRD